MQDINLKRKTITSIAGKDSKNRVALINLDLLRALEAWIDIRGSIEVPTLFVSERRYERMTRQGIYYLVRKYLDSMGLKELLRTFHPTHFLSKFN